ncbi:MAG TPA: hypothetical protein VJ697_12665 [Nitrososphaeraceae archaeon]|nr:hypothetical protein [Nitrososphaeraceae archaeon]
MVVKVPYKKVNELIDNDDWGDAMTECNNVDNVGRETKGSTFTFSLHLCNNISIFKILF